MYKLESGMRFLYNRVAHLQLTTDEHLTHLGERLQALRKTVDNLSVSPSRKKCHSSPHVIDEYHDEDVPLHYSESKEKNPSSLDTEEQPSPRMPAGSNKEKDSSSSSYIERFGRNKMKSCQLSPRGHRGDVNLCEKKKENINMKDSCALHESMKESDKLRSELLEREKNLLLQEQELNERRDRLIARIESLTKSSWSSPIPVRDKTLEKKEPLSPTVSKSRTLSTPLSKFYSNSSSTLSSLGKSSSTPTHRKH